MPNKVRKHTKKSRAMQRSGTTAAPGAAVDISSPASAVAAITPSRAATSPAIPRTSEYPYFTTELKTIGILTGIILVILFMLAMVLR